MASSAASLRTIEDAISRASSPLGAALRELGRANRGRGTCLLLEHEDFGEALIADRHWTRGRAETLKNREHFALVDLTQEHGFLRLAVLVEPTGDEGVLDAAALELTLAALNVTAALARTAEPEEPAARVTGAGSETASPEMPVRLRRTERPAVPPPAKIVTEEGVWGI